MRGTLLVVVMLGACADGMPATPPADSLPALQARLPAPPVAGALSIRLVPEGATTAGAVTDVVAEALVSGGDGTLRVSVDFVAPGGTTFQRSTAEIAAGGERALSFSAPIAGTDAARFPGAWSAVLIGPRGPLASAGFELEASAP